VKWPQQDSDRDDRALPVKMNVVVELLRVRRYEKGMMEKGKDRDERLYTEGNGRGLRDLGGSGVEIGENWAFAVEFEVEMRLSEAGTKLKRAEEGSCFWWTSNTEVLYEDK
jgi:hypothetical protein